MPTGISIGQCSCQLASLEHDYRYMTYNELFAGYAKGHRTCQPVAGGNRYLVGTKLLPVRYGMDAVKRDRNTGQ